MELAHEVREGVAVVTIRGPANQAPDRVHFHAYVKDLIGEGHTRLVFDCGELSWIGSNLLGALIASFCSLRAEEGRLVLASAGPKVVQAIAFNRLSEVIPVAESIEEAVEELGR